MRVRSHSACSEDGTERREGRRRVGRGAEGGEAGVEGCEGCEAVEGCAFSGVEERGGEEGRRVT